MQDFKKLPEYQALRKALTYLALELPEPVHVHVCRVFNEFANALSAATPAPLADAELAELAEAQKGFPKVFVAEGLEIGTIAGWRIAKMNGNKSDAQFAQSIATVWNALPGLLARLAAAEAPKWIAVGDQLPVDEIDNHDNPFGTTLVLVARPAAPYVSAVALGYRYDGEWFIVREGTEYDFVDNSVTHWQLAVAPTVKGGHQDA